MSIKPIIFSGLMVRALLDGRKTQTRRIIKPQPVSEGIKSFGESWAWKTLDAGGFAGATADQVKRFGVQSGMASYAPGDLLWVREGWRVNGWASDVASIFYKAHARASYTEMCEQFPIGGKTYIAPTPGKWKPSIHMPRWASRITLDVTDVRVQRLQEISEEDAKAEGVDAISVEDAPRQAAWSRRQDFSRLWDSLSAKRGFGWDANPWVVALTFTVHRCNVDSMTRAAA